MRLGAAALTTFALLLVATPAGAAGGAGETTITGGFEHGCAIVGTHTVRCWGSNDFGQLGNGQQTTFGAQTTPIDVEGVGEKIAAVAGGLGHTCAIVSAGGGVRCWGYNAHGQLGTGDDTDHLEPSDVVGLGGPVRDLVAGHTHTCAVVGGAPYCWGHNESGQLGDGQPGCDQTNLFRCKSTKPVRVAGLDDVAQLGAGRDHTCALTQGGAVYCWGTNISGQLGTGGPAGLQTTPVLVPGLNGVVAISAGGGHTCALNADGAVACWGLNDSGQLGDGSKTDRHRPVVVIRSGVATIFAAEVHTCAITTKRAVACWGRNQWGELGDGTTRDRHKPVPVSGLGPGSKVTELAGGYQYTCAREGDVDVLCWGKN